MPDSSTSTRALVSYQPQDGRLDWKLHDVNLRDIGPDELLVQVVAAGICHTDLVFSTWPSDLIPYPKVLGHEGSGLVQKVGAGVSRARVGDSVLLSFQYCSACKSCSDGHPSLCHQFAALNYDGEAGVYTTPGDTLRGGFFGQSSFANLAIAKESSVVNVSPHIQNEYELKLFAPMGCGFQTGLGAVDNVASAGESDTVVVLGLGGVGLVSIMAAKLRGCKTIIGVDRLAERLKLAQNLGATGVVNTVGEGVNVSHEIMALSNGEGASVAIDTTGNMDLIRGSIQWTAHGAQIIIIGVPPPEATLGIHLIEFMQTGKTIRGCIEGDAMPSEYIPKMIQWYREGKLPIDKLIKFYEVCLSAS
ncbi:chaperonin 10-like protein [Aspergillus carlsbadensis]|nr:chaperonin 10-like protein [Aspergillus carlsbadensis]